VTLARFVQTSHDYRRICGGILKIRQRVAEIIDQIKARPIKKNRFGDNVQQISLGSRINRFDIFIITYFPDYDQFGLNEQTVLDDIMTLQKIDEAMDNHFTMEAKVNTESDIKRVLTKLVRKDYLE